MRVFKKRQSLVGPANYRQWEDWKEGDVLVGKLIGFGQDKYKKVSLKVLVIDAEFKDKKHKDYIGKELTLNSCGSLNDAYNELKEANAIGTGLQFEYVGQVEVKKGTYAGEMRHEITCTEVDLEDGDDAPSNPPAEVEDDL